MRFIIILFLFMGLICSCNQNNSFEKEKEVLISKYKSDIITEDSALIITDKLINDYDYKSSDLYYDRALLFSSMHKWEDVITSYTKAHNLGLNNKIVWYNRSIAYSKIGNKKDMWNDYFEYKRHFQEDSLSILYLEYELLANINEHEKSLEVIEKILKYNPNSAFYYNEKAYQKFEIGDTLGYCLAIKKAISLGITERLNKTESQLLKICNDTIPTK